MTSANEELWIAFSEEVGEQLDHLDLELSKGTSACDIHQVFRDFHTIKSSCAMLDMSSMKDLAHISEDYLDLVRTGVVMLTEPAIDTLLSAVEKLKQQLVIATTSHQNPEAALEIIGAIRKLLIPQTPSHGDMTTKPEPIVASNVSDRQAELAPLVHLGTNMLRDLAQAQQLTPTLKNSLITFGNMAQLLDLPLLQILCRDIVLTFRHPTEAVVPVAALNHQADLLERIHHIEQEFHLDFGATQATSCYRTTFEKPFLHLILEMADIFSMLGSEEFSVWLQNHYSAAENLLERLTLFARLFGLWELLNLFVFINQVLRSAQRGHFQPRADFAVVLKQSIDHPYAELLHGGDKQCLDALRKAQEQLQQATEASNTNAATNKGPRHIYDIAIDMSSESVVVENLVQWLSCYGRVINSTAALDENEGRCVNFTIEFDMTLEQVKNQLLLIDVDASCFCIKQTSTDHPATKITWDMPQLLGSTLRINSQSVDDLVTQVGEVVMVRNMIGTIVNRDKYNNVLRRCRHILEQEKNKTASPQQIKELRLSLLELMAMRDDLVAVDTRLHAAITGVQQKVLDLREMPVAMIFNRLPNLARKISHALGRNITLRMTGENACVDKGMMELLLKTLAALLQHMMIDGPNTSEVSVDALLRGNHLNIAVTCNSSIAGGAMLTELKNLLNRIGGQLALVDKQKNCTTVTLDFPRSVAMQTVLLVRSDAAVSAIPERNIIEIAQLKNYSVSTLQGRASIVWRNEVIPLVMLNEWVQGVEHHAANFCRNAGSLLVVSSGNRHVGILVDAIVGMRDSFVPEVHASLSSVSRINGATVLGDGSVVFVLNIEHLLQSLHLKLHDLFRCPARRNAMTQRQVA